MGSQQKFQKPNILAVDDKPANLVALEAVLGSDYNLILANSGAEAISIIESREDICTVLMDVQMPKMDGFEAASRIKQLKNGKDIPIIFITAVYKEDPFIRKGYQSGAIDYFSKPFDPEVLKLKIGVYTSFKLRIDVLKERERQIRESEELLRVGRKLSSILESLSVGVLISDINGRICQTNEQVSRIWKATEPLKNDSYGEFLGWWDSNGQMLKDQNGPLACVLNEGVSSHNQLIPIRCFDGSSKIILCSASPLRGLNSHVVGAVIVIQDVTETKKIEEDLEQRINKMISLGMEFEQSAKH